MKLALALLAITLVAVNCSNSVEFRKILEKFEELETNLEEIKDSTNASMDELHEDIAQLYKHKHHHQEKKDRKRRAICGKHLLIHSQKVCGGSLDASPNTNTDLSTTCCSAKTTVDCTEEFIKKAVCPSKV
ncbi:CBN-INS-32 protein [Caenorhabditis brenneri]|uniref:CBN-INS-32 protein n=1 Tax=Caenorhabditis brenneri TaxID=135651 RepID=G0MMU4_CAEBE|nr:CBN-INS-32 protein [Caenorhabditis brenneri]